MPGIFVDIYFLKASILNYYLQLPSKHGQMGPIWAESGHYAQIGPMWVHIGILAHVGPTSHIGHNYFHMFKKLFW